MNKETREFLLECKKVGYEHVTIGVEDKRVPTSVRIEKAGQRKYGVNPSGGAYWGVNEMDGTKVGGIPTKVVCAAPNRRDSDFPAIWKICEDSPLTAGLGFRGCGCSESHEIISNHRLDRGYYNLSAL